MKEWYAASIIMLVKFKDGNQDKYPVWENVVLIKASSGDEALELAEKRGREEEGERLQHQGNRLPRAGHPLKSCQSLNPFNHVQIFYFFQKK